ELRHADTQRLGDRADVARARLDVRIAGGMDVALGPVQPARHLEQPYVIGGGEVAGRSRLDPAVRRLPQHDRHPADLELGAAADAAARRERSGVPPPRPPALRAGPSLSRQGRGKNRAEESHRYSPQYWWAPWAPMLTVYCKRNWWSVFGRDSSLLYWARNRP